MNDNENLVAESQTVEQTAAVESVSAPTAVVAEKPTKFCTRCGGKIDERAVVCPLCGCQVEQIAPASAGAPNIVINNANTNTNTNTQIMGGAMFKKPRDKWVALLLCFFLGWLGVHKFYEGRIGMGILYIFTLGLFGIGVFVDFIVLLFKPNPYYV